MEEGSLFQRMKQIFHEDEMDEEMQKEAAALIRNIFRYMDKDAKDIMTHRKNIVAIDGDWSLEEALKFMLDERFSRFPVYQEDIDEIIGIIHLRDATSGYLDESKRGCPVKELKEYLRPVTYIPETKSIDTLFKEMQSTKNHMVIVLDEYGQTSGLVAMEDILEEPFFLTEKNANYRQALDQQLALKKQALSPVLEISDTAFIIRMLEKNHGLSFLPYLAVERDIRKGRIALLHVEDVEISMYRQIFYHKNKFKTREMEEFIRLAAE